MVESMLAEEELIDVNRRLAEATPTEILQWAVERFFPRLTMATAFGPEGCVLIHLLAEVEPKVRVFNLDTGYQFAGDPGSAGSDGGSLWDRRGDGPRRYNGRVSMKACMEVRFTCRTPNNAATSGRSFRLRRALVGI